YENIIKNSELHAFDVCSVCAPVAVSDSAIGAGGAPLIVNALVNDYDPNNNIKLSTLSILSQPNNGTGYISNNKVVYLPNGSFEGRDTIIYQVCDSTNLCATGFVYFTINPLLIDPCSDATKTHTYFIPYPEKDAYIALLASSNTTMPSNNIRTVISLTMPYPGMTVVWDHWEDGYETNAWNATQTTTLVWGDGNPYNGIAPGYATDIIPAGGSIVLDNTMPSNPRVQANIFYDGRDKIISSGQIAITQVCGEPTRMPVQAIKTNVTSTYNFGQSFTIPLGQNYPSRDFRYTALFVRAQENNTLVEIDKDNNGTLETSFILNEGESYLVDGGVNYGATVTSTKPVGVELNAGGVDQYSIRNAPIYPATWYSNTYYTPVPTSDNAADAQKDTSVVMLYNSLGRPLAITWNSGAPASGIINLPAKGCVRFPLAYSTTSSYKFYNPTGESFTAIEIVDSYTPVSGSQDGTTYDWSFNLIAESRLTDFATTAWAPGGLDLVAPTGPDVNGNPIWVTPNMNTTIYVKWDGNVSGNSGLLSPCGLRYDISYSLNALKYIKLRDPSDNDQSGLAVYTCNGAKLAAVYGEDPQGSTTGIGIAYWDVGTTILPFCKQKLIFANDDYARTMVGQPVTIAVLVNDFGFLAVVDPTSVTNTALLQPKHGSVIINPNGTVIYTPVTGYVGRDTFEYNVCSTPTPIVCDIATVYIDISTCPSPFNENIIIGNVFLDKNEDGISNDGGTGVAGPKVYLYVDGNCNSIAETNELKDSVSVDASGAYQFIAYPEKYVEDDFDGVGGVRTCASGTDGNGAWLTNWVDAGDLLSPGFCNNSQTVANTDCDIIKDGTFTNAIRLKGSNVSATRTVNTSGTSYAFLSFSYRRKSSTLVAGEDVIVQASKDGLTFGTVFTIAGDGLTDANYVNIYNQDITAYASATTYIRFLTNNNVDDEDSVYIDDVKIQFLRYPLCYITKLDNTTIPAYHHTTSALQHNLTATTSQTCFGPNNFGVAKNTISISGTLYQDANGIMDNLVNGTPIGTVSGIVNYAYLVDTAGNVTKRTTLNVSNGTYSFANADVFTNYRVNLSTISVNLGDPTPTDCGLENISGSWVNTGDAFGVNNMAGTGLKPGTPTSSISVTTSISNVTNVNFGIEKLPDSDDKLVSYAINTPGIIYNVPALTGSDPEDGVLGSGKTFKITSLPANATLYYNFLQVTLGQVIPSFNSTLLKIDPDDGIISTFFTFASRDAAGMYDPTPATIRINWVTLLPIKLLEFSGKFNGTKVDLVWKTSSEENSDYFIVERGFDGQEFRYLTKVNAAGFSNQERNYAAIDLSPEKGWNYYRLKMVDKDGAFVYSKIVPIENKADQSLETRVMPNPFTGKVDIYLTLTKSGNVTFKFIDVSGKTVFTKTVSGLKGFNWFIVDDLEKLPSTPYILYVITNERTYTEKLIKR
ncbi:MAG: Ig-like domain-containing protein, partial [Ferruginibacter sp.]